MTLDRESELRREAELLSRALTPSHTVADIEALGHAVALRRFRPGQGSEVVQRVTDIAGGKMQMLEWLTSIDGFPAVAGGCLYVHYYAIEAVQSPSFVDDVNATRRVWPARVGVHLNAFEPVTKKDLTQLASEAAQWLVMDQVAPAASAALVLFDVLCAEAEPPLRRRLLRHLLRLLGKDSRARIGPLPEPERARLRSMAERLERACPSAEAELLANPVYISPYDEDSVSPHDA